MKTTMHSERGFSLVIAVALITLLTMVGVLVLEQVYADTTLAGGERAGQNALALAEAGSSWGQNTMISTLYPNNAATANVAALMAYPTLSTNDPLCPDGVVCTQWYLLTPNTGWVSFGRGMYRVAATCNPGPCTPTGAAPVNYLLRAMGQTGDGATRLIELTLSPS